MTIDNAIRLPHNLAVNILQAAESFDFDMIEAVERYYRPHLLKAVGQGNVSRQKEILNELLRVLERHNEANKNSHYSRNKDVIAQIVAIESGLVSGDPTEWTMARADEFRTPAVSIVETLKLGREKMIADIEAEMLTQGQTRSEAMSVTDFDLDLEETTDVDVIALLAKIDELKAEKKAAGNVRKAIARLQEILVKQDEQYDFYPLTNDLMGALYYHIKGLQEQINSAECDLLQDIEL